MGAPLVRPLFDGPLDIVGDVHGEIDALRDLLGHLGYDGDGSHPEGRRVVFVGDLTDRGPDSPAVVRLVRDRVAAGRAQAVLGNHDLNILLGRKRHGNEWFFGEEFRDDGRVVPQRLAEDDDLRQGIVAFFRSLPLALERPDLRVVHACWRDEVIDVARQADDAAELYRRYARLVEEGNARRLLLDEPGRRLDAQNRNVVKLVTSGPERRVTTPITAGGRVRYEERADWWRDYPGPEAVVFGHYAMPPGRPHSFGQATCVDYAVGYRYAERLKGGTARSPATRLAALRLPEGWVVFDDGEVAPRT